MFPHGVISGLTGHVMTDGKAVFPVEPSRSHGFRFDHNEPRGVIGHFHPLARLVLHQHDSLRKFVSLTHQHTSPDEILGGSAPLSTEFREFHGGILPGEMDAPAYGIARGSQGPALRVTRREAMGQATLFVLAKFLGLPFGDFYGRIVVTYFSFPQYFLDHRFGDFHHGIGYMTNTGLSCAIWSSVWSMTQTGARS